MQRQIKIDNIYLYLLISISFISHWWLFFDSKVLTWGDWIFYFDNAVRNSLQYYAIYQPHYNLGSIMPLPNNYIFYTLYYIFSFFNFSFDIITRIIFLFPIAFFTPLFSFLFLKKLTKNELIAFFGASAYSFNTEFLKLQLDWITYAFLWWIFPALFLCIYNFLEKQDKKYLVCNVFLIFLAISYEIRIAMILFAFFGLFSLFYLIFFKEEFKLKFKKTIALLSSFVIGIVAHAFWIIPFILATKNEVMSSASPEVFVSYFNIIDAFLIRSYQWKNNLILEAFVREPYDIRLFIVPLVSLIGLLFTHNKKLFNRTQRYYMVFFAITLSIFLFLAKQEFGPFPWIYDWLFHNFPLFNLYRESSKFFIIVGFCMSVFFGIGLHQIYRYLTNKQSKIVPILILSLILFFGVIFNIQNFITQDIGGMTKGRVIYSDYKIIEQYFSEKDTNFSRILWVPTKHRFGYYDDTHPYVSAVDMVKIFKEKVPFVLFGNDWPIDKQVTYLLEQEYSNELLDSLSIKYIIIPIDYNNEEKIYYHYGERNYYINIISKIPYLKKIDIGTKEIVVYENENFHPHIYTTKQNETIYKNILFRKINFKQINPTEYKIYLNNINDKIYLTFSETYNSNWKIYIGNFNWFGAMIDSNNLLSEKNHFQNNAHINSFIIDPLYIKQNFDQSLYKQNTDGSINLELTLYFMPQSYFYFGMIISVITLLSCIGYGIYLIQLKGENK